MAKTFRYYNPDQLLLLPPNLREWLPENHLVYFINDIVSKLDLFRIISVYEGERTRLSSVSTGNDDEDVLVCLLCGATFGAEDSKETGRKSPSKS